MGEPHPARARGPCPPYSAASGSGSGCFHSGADVERVEAGFGQRPVGAFGAERRGPAGFLDNAAPLVGIGGL